MFLNSLPKAAGGGADGGLFAMRADRPLVAENTDPTFASPEFPKAYWDSDLYALTILPDFFAGTLGGQSWHQHITVPPPPVVRPSGYTGPVVPNEDRIDYLRILAVTERPEAMGEILNQANNQQLCYMQLLTMTPSSHPKTFLAMKLAARVGEVVMMRLKRQWNRPRPTQYCPTLYPPVAVPGHAAYPAGHALIATLTAELLKEITEHPSATPKASPYAKSLDELAKAIGRNRVIAGLHFWSDIQWGNDAGLKDLCVSEGDDQSSPCSASASSSASGTGGFHFCVDLCRRSERVVHAIARHGYWSEQ